LADIARQRNISTALAVGALLLGNIVNAKETTFTYTAVVEFSRSTFLGVSSEMGRPIFAEEFFNEVVGPGVGSSGSFSVTGSFSWETSTPAFNSNALSAGYVNAITDSTLAWDGTGVSADINNIEFNASSSILGYNTNPSVDSACVTLAGCLNLGLQFTPTGNVIFAANDAEVFDVGDIDGTSGSSSNIDEFEFALGFTDSLNEFSPSIQTDALGEINVGGVIVSLEDLDAVILSDVSIPSTTNFPTLDELESARVAVEFNGTDLISGRAIFLGNITSISIGSAFCNGLPVDVDLSSGDSPTSGPDVIMGTIGNDVINSLGGNDTICGVGGNDVIDAGGGNDWVDGGSGNDDINGSAGNDTLFGAAGDDVIRGGSGDDDIEGEDGDDTLIGQPGNDTIDGGNGVDEINGGGGDDTIFTGPGATVGSGMTVSGSGGNDIINGGPDADHLIGSTGMDIINGLEGDDLITGGTGRDTISGGDGNDDIRGQGSRDTIDGDAGDDIINGGGENDTINGGAGDDEVNGGPGNDVVRGDSGSDMVIGGSGDDTLVGGASGGDVCNGQSGTDSAVASCESTIGTE